jgi:hypothetical protein
VDTDGECHATVQGETAALISAISLLSALSSDSTFKRGSTPSSSMERSRRSGSLPNGCGFVENLLVEKMDCALDALRDRLPCVVVAAAAAAVKLLRVVTGGVLLYIALLDERWLVRPMAWRILRKVGMWRCADAVPVSELWREWLRGM